MPEPLRLLCAFAHPDDETLGCGATLARYAAEGIETFLVTATRGERGRIGTDRPGPSVVGPVREAELRRAAAVLGIREVHFLDYMDAELDRVDPREAITKLAAHLRRIRPQVVVTFGADGAYGHIDHVAISQLTGAAVVAAADAGFAAAPGVELPERAHAVAKLYWMVETQETWAAYERAFGALVYRLGDEERRAVAWPDWQVTTLVDTSAHRETAWRAVDCHQSQVTGYAKLREVASEDQARIWCEQAFYRVLSRVSCSREKERDLFEGLR